MKYRHIACAWNRATQATRRAYRCRGGRRITCARLGIGSLKLRVELTDAERTDMSHVFGVLLAASFVLLVIVSQQGQ